MDNIDKKMIMNALNFAEKAHYTQIRKTFTGTYPYIFHCKKVALILKVSDADIHTICAGVLHDVIEDTKYTYADINIKFGRRVANLVMEVTKDCKGNFNIKTKEGLMIKLADMLDNIHDNNSITYLNKKLEFMRKVRE
jgi:GTP diphosphokinase / guanosine-3',5'-bis(diphosphate) 3'-diphosphatase